MLIIHIYYYFYHVLRRKYIFYSFSWPIFIDSPQKQRPFALYFEALYYKSHLSWMMNMLKIMPLYAIFVHFLSFKAITRTLCSQHVLFSKNLTSYHLFNRIYIKKKKKILRSMFAVIGFHWIGFHCVSCISIFYYILKITYIIKSVTLFCWSSHKIL